MPLLDLVALARPPGLGVWQWGENDAVIAGALRIDDLTLSLTMLFSPAASRAVLLSWRGWRRARRATASSTRCC